MKRRIFILAGAALMMAVLLYVFDLAVAPPPQYLGVSDPSVQKVLLERYPKEIFGSEARIAALYLIMGLVAAIPGVFWPTGGRRVLRWLGAALFPTVTIMGLMGSAICRRPSLFVDSLGRSGMTRVLFDVSSAHGHPWLYLCPALAVVLIWLVLQLKKNPRVAAPIAVLILFLSAWPAWSWIKRSGDSQDGGMDAGFPPVLFIGIDSLRSDILNEWNDGRPLLPNLALIKSEGIFFPRTLTPLARTFPSLVSLVASSSPSVHGIRHMFPRMDGGDLVVEALPEALDRAGYRTGVFADFAGDIFSRVELGFNKVAVPAFNRAAFLQSLCISRHPVALSAADIPGVKHLLPGIWITDGYTEPVTVTRRALTFLGEGEGPPFAMLFYSTGHFPYAAPYPWYRCLAPDDYQGPYRFDVGRPIFDPEDVSPEDMAQVGILYRQALMAVDEAIGRFRERCERTGLWNRALIVIYSDHGEWLGEEGMGFGHGDHLFGERVQMTPLVIRFPDKRWGGKTFQETISIMDAAPTVLGYLGLPRPEGWEGIDLRVAAGGEKIPPRKLACETGLWLDPSLKLPMGILRMAYPHVAGILEFDDRGNIVIQEAWDKEVEVAKHRGVLFGETKLVYAPGGGRAWFYLDPGTGESLEEGELLSSVGSSGMLLHFYDIMDKGGFVRENPYFIPASWREE